VRDNTKQLNKILNLRSRSKEGTFVNILPLDTAPHYSLCFNCELRAKDIALLDSNQPMGLIEFPSFSRDSISKKKHLTYLNSKKFCIENDHLQR
jgi:hypothetical protein